MLPEHLRLLVEISHKANQLAKKLTGSDRNDAYRLKAMACGLLIVEGAATVNGVHSGDIVGLDIPGCRSRIHVRVSYLQPEARRATVRMRSFAPAVAPLKDSWRGPTRDIGVKCEGR